jgi:hypothetical protein
MNNLEIMFSRETRKQKNYTNPSKNEIILAIMKERIELVKPLRNTSK